GPGPTGPGRCDTGSRAIDSGNWLTTSIAEPWPRWPRSTGISRRSQMIDNREDLEAALQRAVELMAEPPEPGCREHEEFLALLREIEANNARIQAEAKQGLLARERAALAQHLSDYS